MNVMTTDLRPALERPLTADRVAAAVRAVIARRHRSSIC
jgi:hypothetical protein